MKKKKNSTRIGVLIIILGVLCLLGGLLLNNTDIFKNTEVPKNKNDNYKKEDYSKKVGGLYESIVKAKLNGCGTYKLFTDKKVTVSDLSNDDIGQYVLYRLYVESEKKDVSKWVGTVYKKSEIDTVVKELFGDKVSFKHGNIDGNISMKYDSSKGKYKVSGSLKENTCNIDVMNKIVKSVDDKKKVTFSVNIIFYKDGKYYTNYAKTNELIVENDETTGKAKIDYSKGTLYNIVLKKVDNNYIFDYVEPVKD